MDYFELKLSEVRLKGSFELFTGLEQNLVKPRTKIKLGKPSGITQFIEQLINNRHRILAFLCNSIKPRFLCRVLQVRHSAKPPYLCRVSPNRHSAKRPPLPSVVGLTLGKEGGLCRVPSVRRSAKRPSPSIGAVRQLFFAEWFTGTRQSLC